MSERNARLWQPVGRPPPALPRRLARKHRLAARNLHRSVRAFGCHSSASDPKENRLSGSGRIKRER